MATTAEAHVAARDRARALVPAVPVVLAGLLLAQALALPTAWLPFDEAAVAARARGTGGGLTGPLLPFLLAPVAHGSAAVLLDTGRGLGVLCCGALFVPTYALARRAASVSLSCAAGALAVCVPAAVYSGALVPEALGTLLAACALWLAVSASERGDRTRLAGAVALGTAAAVARPWFAAVPPALVAAYVLPRVRRPRPIEIALAVAALYGLYYGLGSASPELAHAAAHPWAVLRSSLGSLGAAALGFGALPAVLAAARVGRRPTGQMLAAAAPALALAAGLSGVGRVDERPLVALAPLVFALAAEGLVPVRRLLVSAAAVAGTVLFVAWPGGRPALERAPGLAFVRGLFGGLGIGPALAALLVLAVASVVFLPGRWQPVALAGALLVLVPGGELVAWAQAREESRRLAAALPHPRDWIDRRVGADAHVTLLRTAAAGGGPADSAEVRIWNRSVRGDLLVDPRAAEESTGSLGVGTNSRYAVALGFEPAGRPLGGGLYELSSPLRLASSVSGVYADGWSGADAVYRRFSGSGPASVEVTVSRQPWGGKDVPGHVSIVAAAIGGAATARRDVVIHAARALRVELPVPAPPFEIDVHVEPTFSPAKLGGGSDTRELGALLTFAYRP